MDLFGKTLSNLVKSQFPEHYREHGPLLVSFVESYYRWLETQTTSRDEWFVDKVSLVKITNLSANVIGLGSFFKTQFVNGDQIAVSKGEDTNDYEMFTVRSIANDEFLTLTHDRLPNFSHANTKYATVSSKPNAVFLTRNFPEINDIDLTLDQFVVYFKEKYLKNLQFKTITDTKTLVKHSLDLYRSKGTERSVDLLYKIAFGKPAHVYYPGQDIFRLSSGNWFIPRYLELSLAPANVKLINKEIVGVISGATAFVEEIIRRISGDRIVEVAYISAINGTFITGEKVTLTDNSLDMSCVPSVVGSLNKLLFDIAGAGIDFLENEVVNIQSTNGRGAVGKVVSVSNTSGQVLYSLSDGGYGFSNTIQVANTTGNVSVTAACTTLTGTSTLFESEYVEGDYISVWSNTSAYETHQILNITSNTVLVVDNTWSFSNTQTKAAYTRYFAQTFISEKILTISNATFDSDYINFEYLPFLANVAQPTALINYENANGTFIVGDHIRTYWPNNAVKGEAHILANSKKTTASGILTISMHSGDLDEPAIYTTANAVGANLTVANGYTDTTSTASFLGNYANVTILANSITGVFNAGDTIIQPGTEASGVITDTSLQNVGTEYLIDIRDSVGMFKNGFAVQDSNTGATATVMNTEIEVGVIDISNVFYTLPGNRFYSDYMEGEVTGVSLGSGAEVVFSNTLLYAENIQINTDYISPFLALKIGAVAWPFVGNAAANLSSFIGNTLTYSNLTIGKVAEISATSPGVEYNKIPIVRLHEPTIFSYNLPDKIIMDVSNTAGFDVGEIIDQEDSGARGMIVEVTNSEQLLVQNMRFYSNNAFVSTSNTTTTIVGEDSGYETNIVSVISQTMSSRLGSDITTGSDLVISEGAITAVQVLDSGFGFSNNEQVFITSGDKSALGYAVLETHGSGAGYYKSADGFLSDVKKLSDGWYYQEYSYEVRSAVIDDFKKILKKVVHVSGTKSFDAIVYDSINTLTPTVERIMTIAGATQFRLRDDQSYLLLRNGIDKLILGYEHI